MKGGAVYNQISPTSEAIQHNKRGRERTETMAQTQDMDYRL